MKPSRNSLRPQDIMIALKVRLLEDRGVWNQLKLSQELKISAGEIAFSLERLKNHHLLNDSKKSVKRAALVEFIVHGLKYVFPASFGAPTRGIETGTAIALKDDIRLPNDQRHVWPDPDGKSRGVALDPLYDTVPQAVKKDHELYILLALVDVLRVGGVREQVLAKKQLTEKILNGITNE